MVTEIGKKEVIKMVESDIPIDPELKKRLLNHKGHEVAFRISYGEISSAYCGTCDSVINSA